MVFPSFHSKMKVKRPQPVELYYKLAVQWNALMKTLALLLSGQIVAEFG